MNTNLWRLLALAILLLLTPPAAAALPDGVDGVLGLYPIQENTCLAVEVDLPDNVPLLGLTWFNNDAGTPFEKVILVEASDGPPNLAGPGLVLAQQSGPSLAWGQMNLENGVVSSTGRIFAVFVFPTGGERSGMGESTGAGIGYSISELAPQVFLSSDAIEWARLQPGYKILVEPTFAMNKGTRAGTRATVVLSTLDDLALVHTKNQHGSDAGTPPAASKQGGIISVSPNPFNPQAEIAFYVPAEGHVRLTLFDARGRRVSVLMDDTVSSGTHRMTWPGTDDRGNVVASGVYYLRMLADAHQSVRTITLLK